MACAALHNLCKLDGAVLAGIIAVPMTLALSKAFRLVRYTSHPNTTALESLPLLAGSTAGLLLLVSSRPLVPPQYTASVILAVGALAIIPLLISRSRAPMSLNLKSRRLRRRKTASAPKPEPRLEAYDDAISSSATSPTAPSIFSKTSDEELHCKIESDTDTPSHTPFATVPGTPADTDDHRLPFLSDKDHTTADLSSLGQAIENSTRIDRTPGHASDAMGPDNLALEDEFVRLLLRSAARGSKTSKLCSFGVWKDEWPVYWEGAGLAAKGSW